MYMTARMHPYWMNLAMMLHPRSVCSAVVLPPYRMRTAIFPHPRLMWISALIASSVSGDYLRMTDLAVHGVSMIQPLGLGGHRLPVTPFAPHAMRRSHALHGVPPFPLGFDLGLPGLDFHLSPLTFLCALPCLLLVRLPLTYLCLPA